MLTLTPHADTIVLTSGPVWPSVKPCTSKVGQAQIRLSHSLASNVRSERIWQASLNFLTRKPEATMQAKFFDQHSTCW